ncbi:hypothetical protein ACPOL_5302 [Acidisarcina polymorpha]|uniref:Uncharacterized protein n=1 Tax=Acidisarcina polymorpha TaxID=2211140 RepID=A0A2Z5G5R8_9BACT|nr:hypothetical protein ACPOL_5302 [Acidisarcina polymorpha]
MQHLHPALQRRAASWAFIAKQLGFPSTVPGVCPLCIPGFCPLRI